MTRFRRLGRFILIPVLILGVITLTTWAETTLLDSVDVRTAEAQVKNLGFFFGLLNLNVLLLALFCFLAMRSAVRLTVDRKQGVFGSSLQTKLVSSFLFFALLPTVVLLYMSNKFVNASFDHLLSWKGAGSLESEEWAPPVNLLLQIEAFAPGVQLLRVSYTVMLVVITLLILFSATWLGFTIAREVMSPIKILAQATDRVAQGDYSVQIDEIISDDEMGRLAQSFRSMVADLRLAQQEQARVSQELQRQAQSLFEKSEYNSFLLHHVNTAIVTLCADCVVRSLNQRAEQLFEISSDVVVGSRLDSFLDPALCELVSHQFLQIRNRTLDLPFGSENRFLVGEAAEHKGLFGGVERQMVLKAAEFLMQGQKEKILLIEDVTELAQAQRISAWRDVARRVAHEIKNPLTPITLGVQRLQRRFGARFEGVDADVFQDSTRVVLDSTESIRNLVDEFIQFARMPPAMLRPSPFLLLLSRSLSGFQAEDQILTLRVDVREKGEKVELLNEEFANFDAQHPVSCDPEQMHRLVRNLLQNAMEACRESGCFDIQIAVEYDLDESRLTLEFLDSGPGVSPELKAKIFEPYFSTKTGGMGLGLAIVKQIVAEHSGRISVRDRAAAWGTSVCVRIPISTTV